MSRWIGSNSDLTLEDWYWEDLEFDTRVLKKNEAFRKGKFEKNIEPMREIAWKEWPDRMS